MPVGNGKSNQMIQPDLMLEPAPSTRKASREARRVQLIEATIETIAVRGFARTTLTDVAQQAGLSHGLVNFHFETKEKLLGRNSAPSVRRICTELAPGAGQGRTGCRQPTGCDAAGGFQ